jgi:hypothetical protein
MSDVQTNQHRAGPAPSLFLYLAACAVLLLGIIGAVMVDAGAKCPDGAYPSGSDSCISFTASASTNASGSIANPYQQTSPAGKDWKLDIRAEMLLASGAVALVIAYFAARAYRRERGIVA